MFPNDPLSLTHTHTHTHTHMKTGVSYMFPNDDVIYAHISSKHSSSNTSSQRFEQNIAQALADIKETVELHMEETKAAKKLS